MQLGPVARAGTTCPFQLVCSSPLTFDFLIIFLLYVSGRRCLFLRGSGGSSISLLELWDIFRQYLHTKPKLNVTADSHHETDKM